MSSTNNKYQVKRFMTVLASFMPEGMEMSCWMSTVEFWAEEVKQYPHEYDYMVNGCDWVIHSNIELSEKLIAAVGDYAQKICEENIAINNHRQPVNRRKNGR